MKDLFDILGYILMLVLALGLIFGAVWLYGTLWFNMNMEQVCNWSLIVLVVLCFKFRN